MLILFFQENAYLPKKSNLWHKKSFLKQNKVYANFYISKDTIKIKNEENIYIHIFLAISKIYYILLLFIILIQYPYKKRKIPADKHMPLSKQSPNISIKYNIQLNKKI